MKTSVVVLLFGLVALSTADYNGRLRHVPVKSYGQPAPVVEEAAVVVEEEPVYKAAVKAVHRAPAPIRVSTPDYNSGYKYDEEKSRLEDDQAKNAHYSFGSAIDDGIMDHSHIRQETRDGLKVEGSYAYSDGYFKRVVNYIADENGYRIVSESVEPISETGPNVDLVNGKADVHTNIGGVDNQYSVSASEIPLLKNLKH